MFGMGTPELIIVLGIAFLIFGGKKLPEIGSGLGQAISSFKKGLREAEETVPGVKEVASLKEEVSKVKELANPLSK